MNVSIIGTGYVGLVTGACLAELGHKVVCVDTNEEKVEGLNKGIMPIYEPGLEELVQKNVGQKRLFFSTSIEEAVNNSDIIFIAVWTPSKDDGRADLSYVEAVARQIAQTMKSYKIIVEKSTVPVETGERVAQTVEMNNINKVDFDIVSNPEFLREGSAIYDTMNPDRIVLGVSSEKAFERMKELYKDIKTEIIKTDIKTAEIIKHASNSFLAMKISFINAVANICDLVGADVVKVAQGMGCDKRIGNGFLNAGVGYGGSCFPKDIKAFIKLAEKAGYEFKLLKEVEKINEQQRDLVIKKIEKVLWTFKDKTIGILGLSFKPNTDDMRSSPAIDIIKSIRKEGAKVKVYDPQAMPRASQIEGLKRDTPEGTGDIEYCDDAYQVAKEVDLLVILTEWDEFKQIDLIRIKGIMKHPLIVDGRNIYEPKRMKELGFTYLCVGRKN